MDKMDWKKEYSVMYNARSAVVCYYKLAKGIQPTDAMIKSWNNLEYDALRKLAMMYRSQWLNDGKSPY